MKLILYDVNKNLCDELQKYFEKYTNIEILNCSFAQLPQVDCIVSPANSFGIMDGGIDLAFTKYFGTQLMQRVQQQQLPERAKLRSQHEGLPRNSPSTCCI